ncbi:MAG: lysophospholipid acyltransferase family protein [Kofleriaceae bacterium]
MADADVPSAAELTRIEKVAIRLAAVTNEHPVGKVLQDRFLRGVTYPWVRLGMAYRCLFEGLDDVVNMEPDRGLLFASNHRSFFDQYAILLGLYLARTPWIRSINFPVRSNFFYEQPLGMLVNWGVAAGVMYPPVFRQRERAAANKATVDKLVALLANPGAVVGVHPEGTRNKGDDPYEMLPAMPGIGQIALQAKPIAIPVWIGGLENDFISEFRVNYKPGIRRERPVIAVFGQPIDYREFLAQKPRPALYKKCADLFRDEILKLSVRERELRAQCRSGAIGDDDPRWIINRDHDRVYAHQDRR